MKTSQKIGITAAAGIISVGSLLGVALANAEDPTDTASPSASASSDTNQQGPGRGGHGGEMGGQRGAQAALLAEKLGLDETVVADAIQAAHEATRPTEPPADGSLPDRDAMRAAFVTELASQLGVDEATLTTALDEIEAAEQADRQTQLQTRLDEAVAAGTITQADADAVLRVAAAGVLGGGPRGR